ncbi:MAG: phage holin family protein [Clostridiales bacterium]|nr:phage holin family protein [Clostridiales bacterium]
MEKTINQAKAALVAVMGLLTGLWGWLGWLVVGWICCMALDYLTGSLAAAKEGQWSSGKAREGIWHKCGMIVVVAVAAGVDMLLALVLANLPLVTLPFEYAGLVCPIVLVWYIVTELGSIVENAVAMGAVVPAWLVKLLAMSKSAVDSAGDKLSGDDNEQR